MKVVLPPLFFYGVAALLIVLGALRAYHLGWKSRPGRAKPPVRRPPLFPQRPDGEPASGAALEAGETVSEELEDEEGDDELDEEEVAAEKSANKNANRHIKFGLLW